MSESKTVNVLDLLTLSFQLGIKAGRIINEVFTGGDLKTIDKNKKNAEQRVMKKGEDSKAENPQTVADRKAQLLICGGLKAAFPTLNVRGEEDGEMDQKDITIPDLKDVDISSLPDAKAIPNELKALDICDIVVWVDPLDGTREYTQGILEAVTCLIGICYRGRPVAGVVNRPFFGETAAAIVGAGYFLSGFNEEKKAAIARFHADTSTSRRVVLTSRSHGGGVLDEYIATKNPDSVVKAGGCGGKVLMLIEGKGDAYVFPKRGTKKWDTAAPEAILLAMGGYLTKPDGSIYTYEDAPSNVQNPLGLIATRCGGAFHASFCR